LSRIRNYLKPVENQPRECDLNRAIRDCLALLFPEIEQGQVTVSMDAAARLPLVRVDPGILSQILINLIRNSLEAMKKGGNLTVSAYEHDTDLNIQFSARAPGLEIRDPDRLFPPFAEGGRSIGLPLCYPLLQDIGRVLSFEQGRGQTVFTVSLPKTRVDGD
jgi:two-component system sensor histidine kinase HydH